MENEAEGSTPGRGQEHSGPGARRAKRIGGPHCKGRGLKTCRKKGTGQGADVCSGRVRAERTATRASRGCEPGAARLGTGTAAGRPEVQTRQKAAQGARPRDEPDQGAKHEGS